MAMTTDDTRATADIENAIAFQRDLYLYWRAAREIGEFDADLPWLSRALHAAASARAVAHLA